MEYRTRQPVVVKWFPLIVATVIVLIMVTIVTLRITGKA